MTRSLPGAGSFGALLLASAGLAAGAQQLPAVHLIDRPIAASAPFGSVRRVRHLPDGGVLVNDAKTRRLVLLDSTLQRQTIVADASSARPYGSSGGVLMAYAGDSSVFLLPAVPSMYMIAPDGSIARVAAPPRPEDALWIGSILAGLPGYDAFGRLVYRGPGPRPKLPLVEKGAPPAPFVFPDTNPLVRANPSTRKLDTLTLIHASRIRGMVYPTERGTTHTTIQHDVLQVVDDWTILADGSIAIVRGQDYHIDFVNPDGSLSKSPRTPFAWEHLSDEEKIALVDSVRAADGRKDRIREQASATPGTSAAGSGSSAFGAPPGNMIPGTSTPLPATLYPGPEELPDYRPPFDADAVRGDADNHIWICTTHRGPYGTGDVYDVIDRKGVLIDRVQLQPGRSIAGFGKNGIVYLTATDGTGATLEKVLWHVSR